MSTSENELKFAKASAANQGRSLWEIVIGFFVFAALCNAILSSLIPSHRLAGEIAFFVALVALYLVIKPLAEVDATQVTSVIAGSGLYIMLLMLSLVMRTSLALGVAVLVFTLVRNLLEKRFPNADEEDQSDDPNQPFASVLFRSLLLGGLAFVISELVLRGWSLWQSR